jgi:hypothetical protein
MLCSQASGKKGGKTPIVIPAQAGIQDLVEPIGFWIPAAACPGEGRGGNDKIFIGFGYKKAFLWIVLFGHFSIDSTHSFGRRPSFDAKFCLRALKTGDKSLRFYGSQGARSGPSIHLVFTFSRLSFVPFRSFGFWSFEFV